MPGIGTLQTTFPGSALPATLEVSTAASGAAGTVASSKLTVDLGTSGSGVYAVDTVGPQVYDFTSGELVFGFERTGSAAFVLYLMGATQGMCVIVNTLGGGQIYQLAAGDAIDGGAIVSVAFDTATHPFMRVVRNGTAWDFYKSADRSTWEHLVSGVAVGNVSQANYEALELRWLWSAQLGGPGGGYLKDVNAVAGGGGGVTVTGVDVSPASASIGVGATQQLTAVVSGSGGTPTQDVTWSSGATGVATVDSAGLVTGVSAGSATITATRDGFTDTCVVTVAALPALTVSTTSPTGTVARGGALLVPFTITRGAGFTGDVLVTPTGMPAGVHCNPVLVPSGSTSGTATVVCAGAASAGGPTTVTFTATGTGATSGTDTFPLTVTTPSTTYPKQWQASTVARDISNNPVSRPKTWASSNTGLATTTATGLVERSGAGAVNVTAQARSGNTYKSVTTAVPV